MVAGRAVILASAALSATTQFADPGPARNRFRTASLNAYNATVPEAVDMDLQFIAYQPEDDDVPEVIIGSNQELSPVQSP